ncbi:uncharacterized protein LOC123269778 [Cotesia glomerata]|uniref:uncharacterized protein LOC123269778 n=1 Tax=Cotesia glomerata TaxID=32391 RepID=UPI001D0117F1|nr:uncharacterized protein LOC123269778 [Cotesia glomerata]
MDLELNPTTADNSLMYQAIEDDKLEDLKLLLENGMDVNEPIITTGEFAGFTALHVACMKNKDHLVELLVFDYNADVNAMAADGTQPIHLACFYEPVFDISTWVYNPKKPIHKIRSLVTANANVNAEFGQEIFSKHVKDEKWCPDFGDKMPIVAYIIIYDKPIIMCLFEKVNLNTISLTNKTLLMYAIEYNRDLYISDVMKNVKDPELRDKLINHRDNDDIPLTHYPFHPEKYGKFRYHESTLFVDYFFEENFIPDLLKLGADIYALINNNPATFLPNLSAYRGCTTLLEYALPYYTSMSLSRVLYYATLPIDENSEHLISYKSDRERLFYLVNIRRNQKDCIAIALRDLVLRSAFRLPVSGEEIKLMDQLIASDENLREIINDFKINFIEKELKECFIKFGDYKMTMYDFSMQVFDSKKLKLLAREEDLINVLSKFFEEKIKTSSHSYFTVIKKRIKIRIVDAQIRLDLLQLLKTIPSLREAIPLPFEVVLDIVEYLNNIQLFVLINAFYSFPHSKMTY